MTISAWKIRSALGNLNVGLDQIEGLVSGAQKATPEAWKAALAYMKYAADVLHEEAKLVESGRTPTLCEWDNMGRTKFMGTMPYTYSPAETVVITTDTIRAIEKMVK